MSRWQGIDEFLAVAETGSFVRGAKAVGKSQTHVSRTILALERRLQSQLFYRTTRVVRLTEAGRVFLDGCQRISAETDEMIGAISETGEPQGELRMTCPAALGERFISPILRNLLLLHPKLSVRIEHSNRVIDLVAEGYDLGIRTGQQTDPRLSASHIASRRIYTCAAPAYLERKGLPLTLDALPDHECIVGPTSTWHFDIGGQDVLRRPKGRLRCNSGHAVLEACIAGFGLCQLPDFYVLSALKERLIMPVLQDFAPKDEAIWAVYPHRRHLLPKVRVVIDHLTRELTQALQTPPSL